MTSLGSLSALQLNGRAAWQWKPEANSALCVSGRGNVFDPNVRLWTWRKKAEGRNIFPTVSSSRVGEMGNCIAAVGNGGLGKAHVDGGDDDVEGVEELIKTAVEKNKKVLAVQSNIRQQIASRRKIVALTKGSMADSSNDDASCMSGEYQSEHGIDLQSRESNGEDIYMYSNAYSESLTTMISETKTVHTDGGYINDTKEIAEESQIKCLAADSLGLPLDIDSMETKSTTDLSLLSFPIKPHVIQDENAESVTEAYKDMLAEQVLDSEGPVSAPLAGPNVMNVILVAAECSPWSKTGGLGDVAGALPKALAKRGHRVMVVVPMYGNYAEPQEVGLRKIYNVDGQDMEVTYHHAYIDGVDFVFLGSAIFRGRQDDIYGGQRMDILKRMVLLCKTAVEVPWTVPCGGVCYGDGNLVFIANDWHTALLPVYLKAYYRDNGLMQYARSVLVIHNIAHQGRGPLDDFRYLNLPPHYLDVFRLFDPVGGEHLNIFTGGIKTADRVVTVSRGYAWELKTAEGGWGLHNIMSENDWKLQGIVNGIDTEDWNPELDVHLKSDGYTNYSCETLGTGKPQCKAALQREVHLPLRDVPLFAFVGRLDGQKGVDIIVEAIPWLVGRDAQLVLLGTGRSDLEVMLRNLEGLYHDKVIGRVGFSVSLAHRITAGADVLLMPSRFEPCGLNQLYAMRYGTIPVVHAVGGLKDTVEPFDPFAESGVGWAFERAEVSGLIDAMSHCLDTYWNYRSSWEGLQRRGMAQELGWESVAERYEEALVAAKYQW